MKISRYVRSTSKNQLFYRISPIFFPTSNHILPGRHDDVAVAARLLWVGPSANHYVVASPA